MEAKRSGEGLSPEDNPIKIFPGQESWFPPWLFRHTDIIDDIDDASIVSRAAVINMVNHFHFTDRYILVLLAHKSLEESLVLRANPDPCVGSTLVCEWVSSDIGDLELEDFQLLRLFFDDGCSLTMVPADLKKMDRNRFTVQIPETSFSIGKRQAKRYACKHVEAELIQNGFQARGLLLDYSPVGLRVRVSPAPHCSFRWFNCDESVDIRLRQEDKILYSGRCHCVRQEEGLTEREVVLAPVEWEIKRFKKKHVRNVRQRLVPSPYVVFEHPFLGERVEREIQDISTSGFSVCEESEQRVLLPGMIIPKVTICFGGAIELNCSAQVIYCSKTDGGFFRCGMAILDMKIDSYSRMTHILTNALDPHAHISSHVDVDALWEFFFRTGFIYPKKYRLIQSHKEKFKETYKKLYQENPEIARHFTYQRNGRIYGHISMVRAYSRTWMIHHHAAEAMDNKRTGLMVLKQIMHYLNDMYRLPSANMDYVMCYFRPENKFPDRVFGGFARELGKPQGCSLDLFAYLPYTGLSLGSELPEGWTLGECSTRDLWKLGQVYACHSGGLMFEALDLGGESFPGEPLEEIYSRHGLLRRRRTYALKHGEELCAILMVNQSSLGFNLSELLNGIKVLVVKPNDLPWNILSIAVARLTGDYNIKKVPILFFPLSYVKSEKIPYEKKYQLWILNVHYGNEYLEYMQRRFRISYK